MDQRMVYFLHIKNHDLPASHAYYEQTLARI